MLLYRQKVSGFTLIELLVVLLVLSILGASALARFSRTDDQARIAALASLKASLLAEANLARGACLSDPSCNPQSTDGTSSTQINGDTIYTHLGFPVAWHGGHGEGSVVALIEAEGFTVASSEANATDSSFLINKAPDNQYCKVVYHLGTTTQAPVITVNMVSSGC